jgi:sialic acid synthase SpsE
MADGDQDEAVARMPALIAEIGMNHLGDEVRARRMLEGSLESGVDSVTFQVREPRFYESAETSGLKLPNEFYREAASTAHQRSRQFGMAICDQAMVEPLDAMGVDFWKTLSWDFRNHALRAVLQATGKPVFFSTGLSSSQEVRDGSQGQRNGVLIHTQLSLKTAEVNLKAISSMQRDTGLPVAFGLHCGNHDVLKLALAFEPHSILFYVKESGTQARDDEHAIPMEQLASLVDSLKELSGAIGTGIKMGMDAPAWVKVSK